MSEKIEVQVKYTPEDYARALKFISNRQFIAKYSVILLPFFVVPVLLYYYLTDPEGLIRALSHPLIYLIVGGSILICAGFIVLTKDRPGLFLKWHIRKQFRSSHVLQEPQQITIDEEGFSGSTNLSQGKTKWEAYIEAVETKNDFLFFTSNKVAHFVPKRVFTPEQLIHIRELVKRKLGAKAKSLQ